MPHGSGATDDDIANLDTPVAAEDTIVVSEAPPPRLARRQTLVMTLMLPGLPVRLALDGGAKADLAACPGCQSVREIDKQAAIADAIATPSMLCYTGEIHL